MADPLFINDLIAQIVHGRLRIPSFQRGFVWDADRVAHLMDSIYKGYPFGSLLFWRTKTALKTERRLGPFELPDNDADYPIDYVLDGQQRATSIFGVFQNQLPATDGEDDSWTRIYYDLKAPSDAQDSQFAYLPESEVDHTRHFPLGILFDPPAYRQFLKTMDDSIADAVDNLYRTFTTAKIPVQTFSTDDRTAVAIVFERINRLGVELDTLQLLSAWSWSDEFDLQEQFSTLANDLAPYGFHEVGGDTELLLRCCAAIISGDASPKTIIELRGADVRSRFEEIRAGIVGAIDFLRTNLKAYSTNVLPFPTVIIPLSVFFATDRDQSTHPNSTQQVVLTRWLWRTFFTRRYSKRLEQLNQDVTEIKKLRDGAAHRLGEFDCSIDASFFNKSTFNLRSTNTRTHVLLLATMSPLDFLSGGEIELNTVLRECNKKEFHHIYPRAMLANQGADMNLANSIANFCLLSRASNNIISNKPPSLYRELMPEDPAKVTEIMNRSLCPIDIFHDDFERFIAERCDLLVQKARQLMQ